jgi:RNase H-fold protein (predicted Holliday junction resolvase)
MFNTLKKYRSQKFVWGYPTEFEGSTQNSKKNIGTSNQPIKTNIFPKKVF